MKNSRTKAKILDLERDLPTSSEDVEAQKRVENLGNPKVGSYLDFLESLSQVIGGHKKRDRIGPRGDKPFEL